MKKIFPVLLAGLVIASFSLTALAAPPQGRPAPPKPEEQMMNPVEQEKARSIIAEFEGKLLPLQDKLWGKFLELRALGSVSGVTKEDISKVVDEIVSLRAQIRTEHENLAKAFEKEGLPPAKGYHGKGFGGHMGMMGYGMGPCGMMGDGACPDAMDGMKEWHHRGMMDRADGPKPRGPRPHQSGGPN